MVIVLGCHGVDKAKPEDEYLNVPIPTFSHELWVMTERDHGSFPADTKTFVRDSK